MYFQKGDQGLNFKTSFSHDPSGSGCWEGAGPSCGHDARRALRERANTSSSRGGTRPRALHACRPARRPSITSQGSTRFSPVPLREEIRTGPTCACAGGRGAGWAGGGGPGGQQLRRGPDGGVPGLHLLHDRDAHYPRVGVPNRWSKVDCKSHCLSLLFPCTGEALPSIPFSLLFVSKIFGLHAHCSILQVWGRAARQPHGAHLRRVPGATLCPFPREFAGLTSETLSLRPSAWSARRNRLGRIPQADCSQPYHSPLALCFPFRPRPGPHSQSAAHIATLAGCSIFKKAGNPRRLPFGAHPLPPYVICAESADHNVCDMSLSRLLCDASTHLCPFWQCLPEQASPADWGSSFPSQITASSRLLAEVTRIVILLVARAGKLTPSRPRQNRHGGRRWFFRAKLS